MNFQNSISSKEFCRKNCGGCGKEKFFEEYYRILHTAYLRSGNSSCLDVIRNDFENSFGTDLDTASVSYIYATSKYLVYDVVVAALLNDGKIDSQYYFYKLVIELGFDVWLISALESGVRLTMNYFYEWLPLQKNEKTERAVSDFWHFRLPKAHKFSHLYDGIKQYKREILITYRKLLLAKNDVQLDRGAVESIIKYIDGLIPRKKNPAPASKTVNTHIETVETVAVPAEPVVAEPVIEEPVAAEPVAVEPVIEEPVAVEPVVEEPVAVEPVVIEPVTVEPAVPEAVAIEPVIAAAVAEQIISETSVEEFVENLPETESVQPNDELFFGEPAVNEVAEAVPETERIIENIEPQTADDIQEIFAEETVIEAVDSESALEAIAVPVAVEAVSETPVEPEVVAEVPVEPVAPVIPVVDEIEEPEYDDAPVLPDNAKEIELVLAEEEPVPEKPEVQPDKQEIKEEVTSSVSDNTEEKPPIKVVNPADFIPYKAENSDFVSDRKRAVLRKVEKSINSEKSCRGFKKNCREITKDKIVTAAVCVGIAGVLLVPLAITCCMNKGKKK